MPYDQVLSKFKAGALKSGGNGAKVTNPKQAIAIEISEKKAAHAGKKEYQSESHSYDSARPKRPVQSRYSK